MINSSIPHKHALYYAKQGISMIPIKKGGKQSLIEWEKYQQTRADETLIRSWWQRWPEANLGIVTGAVSGIVVLDVDSPDGMESLKKYNLHLPPTPTVQTGGGGLHYYFRHPGYHCKNFTKKYPGIDFRGDGGYVVAPPSLHKSGNYYTWLIPPWDEELADAPDWLLNLIEKQGTGGKLRPEEWKVDIPKGERNDELTRRAGSLLAKGIPAGEVLTMILAINKKHCKPPLPEGEVKAIVESIGKREAQKPQVVEKAEAEKDNRVPFDDTLPFRVEEWPAPINEAAYHGLAGTTVQHISAYSEADPVAILVNYLIAYGNVIGRSPYFKAGPDKHYMNLFISLVGETAKGRKGMAWGHAREIFKNVDENWIRDRNVSGLSSGEGLIWAVRDEIEKIDTDSAGNETVSVLVDGIDDKRLLVVEPEFASALKVMNRQGNTLSTVIRRAWDEGNMQALTKNSPAKATSAHISIIAHITRDELLRVLTDTEKASGFANRFIWLCVQRSKFLPDGNQVPDFLVNRLVKKTHEAVEFARTVGEMHRDEEAAELWRSEYERLSEAKPGLYGAMIARSEPQVMRLGCIYALLDKSDMVRKEHLRAALALWEYSENSCRYIFGGSTSDPTEAEILGALEQGEMTQTEVYHLFDGNTPSHVYKNALTKLYRQGLITYEKRKPKGGGATCNCLGSY